MTRLGQPGEGRFMIRSVDIRNFRCFKHLAIDNCARLNVIVGDNGAGKTALLEALFLTLAASTEVALRLRTQRGLEGSYGGTHDRIQRALWGGFFYGGEMSQPISLTLTGDGVESRSLEIAKRGASSVEFNQMDQSIDAIRAPIDFTWRDSMGNHRTVSPQISDKGLVLPSTGEEISDFFHIPANANISASENADRFSELSQKDGRSKFVEVFTKEYDWISDLNVEVYARQPVLFATLKSSGMKLPLPNVSAGLNRIVSIMLAIASSTSGVVIVDEIENGIYFQHLGSVWNSLLEFSKEYQCQLFVSTHSAESINALVKASADDIDDVALWQIERGPVESRISTSSGSDLKLAVQYGEEVR